MLSPSKKGAYVELLATTLFIEAGLEVFVNASADGPADIFVWNGTDSCPVDTKACKKYIRRDGGTSYSWSPNAVKPNVAYLGYCGGEWIWLSVPPVWLLEAVDLPVQCGRPIDE